MHLRDLEIESTRLTEIGLDGRENRRNQAELLVF